jgi:Flp pilus assembly protein TadG
MTRPDCHAKGGHFDCGPSQGGDCATSADATRNVMGSNPSPRRSRRPKGQSLVELAITLPFALLLMLGTLDVGRMFFDYIELRNAVREGAAYASRFPTDSSGAQSRVSAHGNLASSATITGPSLGGNCTTIGGTGTATMSATKTFTPITTSFLAGFGLGSVTLSSSATMRCLT